MKKIFIFILSFSLMVAVSLYDSNAVGDTTFVETFDDLNIVGSLQNGSYIGQDGVVFTYYRASNSTRIDGTGITIGSGPGAEASLNFSFTKGLESLQFNYAKHTVGSSMNGRIKVDVTQGEETRMFTIPTFGSIQDDNIIFTFYANIGFDDSDIVNVKIYDTTRESASTLTAINNITWTYPSSGGSGYDDGYADGWDDAIQDYIDNILPGLLAQANQQGYNDGNADGIIEGYADGYDDGRHDYAFWDIVNQVYINAENYGIIQYDNGYDDGYADGLNDGSSTSTHVIGSLTYSQSTSTDYTVSFSLPTHNSTTQSLGDILSDVSGAFSGNNYAMYVVRQPEMITYEYELRNANSDIIEIMPKFDMILFMSDTDEMVILLNGNVIKYYNNSMGIERMTLRYTGFPNEDYESGYLAGLNDGLLDGQTAGYIDGYSEARRELWTVRYELGYNEARGEYGYFDSETNEWISATLWGSNQYLEGYYYGLNLNNSEAFNEGFNKGYSEGSTDSFNAKLSEWIVPAIVIVLFLGGIIVIFNRRLGGRDD